MSTITELQQRSIELSQIAEAERQAFDAILQRAKELSRSRINKADQEAYAAALADLSKQQNIWQLAAALANKATMDFHQAQKRFKNAQQTLVFLENMPGEGWSEAVNSMTEGDRNALLQRAKGIIKSFV